MTGNQPIFDPIRYKQTTRQQWERAAEAWYRWGPLLHRWLGPATERMLDLAGVGEGARVLDVAAGAGEQTLAVARRIGAGGRVLATDISPAILAYAESSARAEGHGNVTTRELDSAGECLRFEKESFGALHQMLSGLDDGEQEAAWTEIEQALETFESGGRFTGPCELVLAVGTR